MAGIWPFIKEGGPWAAFLVLLGWVIWMRLTDRWVADKGLDRVVAGYVETNRNLASELDFWRKAAATKDQTIGALTEQNGKLMAHSAVSAHALDSIVKEAEKRGLVD